MSKARKPRLGRGLSSLVSMPQQVSVEPPKPDEPAPAPGTDADPASPADASGASPRGADAVPAGDGDASGLRWLAVTAVSPNRYQPRREFDETALAQLAGSIKRDGLMQPIIVRPVPDSHEAYELVAGERRWRAAQQAGLEQVPAIVRDLDDQQAAEWAVVENLQREDLNPIERAQAFARLIEEFELSHEQVAERVGVGRPTVSNTLRLMELPAEVQDMVRNGQLTGGASRALLSLDDPQAMAAMAKQAVAGGWSVRTLEAAVRRVVSEGDSEGAKAEPAARPGRSPVLADLEEQLASQLHTKVKIRRGKRKGSGTLMIEFFDLDQFDTLLQRLDVTLEQ
ncbi:MAG: ParB/RepB/Spo0J family partition protein [Phycisphaeraceae bacterium]